MLDVYPWTPSPEGDEFITYIHLNNKKVGWDSNLCMLQKTNKLYPGKVDCDQDIK